MSAEFAVLVRAKPGSVLADGSVVDWLGVPHLRGPCFVPREFGVSIRRTISRTRALALAGWRYTPAVHMPAIPPNDRVVCIDREPAIRRWCEQQAKVKLP